MISIALLKEKKWWWLPFITLLFLNLIVFIAVHFLFSGTIRETWTTRTHLEQEVRKLESKHRELKAKLGCITDTIKKKNDFYALLGEKDEALTRILTDVEKLTRKAGLIPHSWGFGEKEMSKQAPLLLFSIALPLEGSYANVRKLLHFLELSDTFVVVSGISLREAGEMQADVGLSIKMETYFHVTEPPGAPAGKRKKR